MSPTVPLPADLPRMFRPAPKLAAVPSQPAAADRESLKPAAGRTITYPLVGGGFLTAPCPSWCTVDHSDDAEHGIAPGELLHQGDKLSLPFELADGSTIEVLSVRIEQYPYAHDGESDRVHAALVPSEDDGEQTGYLSAAELQAEIQRTYAYLASLGRLAEQLAEARTEQHAAFYNARGLAVEGAWHGLSPDDVETMPLPYLLRVFRATVVGLDSPDETLVNHLLAHPDGTHTVNVDRRLTSLMRERAIRQLLANRLYVRSAA
ncbi:DUF6907 domain-containing protein [Streptomyces sp. NPDC098789]|uniref:DUF6907 domain-containing protein n=1 Tax=Streptomyces sp. NPDC098789 TaxID=3366098 RepID=UPI0037F7D500